MILSDIKNIKKMIQKPLKESKNHLYFCEFVKPSLIKERSSVWKQYRKNGFSVSECDLITCKHKLSKDLILKTV